MLEHLPSWIGKALSGARAGADTLVIVRAGLAPGLPTLELTSPAFAHQARMPPRFTADGAGVSPPLVWNAPPSATVALALIVEDADAPAPQPLVHAILWGIEADAGRLAEGDIVADGDGAVGANGMTGRDVGRNSFLREGWLPPDPPSGHGVHRYVFQVFALDAASGDPGPTPGRAAFLEAITGHVLAAGVLVGTYSRDEPAGMVRTDAMADRGPGAPLPA